VEKRVGSSHKKGKTHVGGGEGGKMTYQPKILGRVGTSGKWRLGCGRVPYEGEDRGKKNGNWIGVGQRGGKSFQRTSSKERGRNREK